MSDFTRVEVIESIKMDIKDKTAIEVAKEIQSLCECYGLAASQWRIVNWDIGRVTLSRTYTKDLHNG